MKTEALIVLVSFLSVQSLSPTETLLDSPETQSSETGKDSLALVANGCQAFLWNTSSGEVLRTFLHPNEGTGGCLIFSTSFSTKGDLILTAGWGGLHSAAAVVWSVATGAKLQTFIHNSSVLFTDPTVVMARFNVKGDLVVTASGDNTAAMWSVESGAKLHTFQHYSPPIPYGGGVRSASFNDKGDLIVTSADDGTAVVWSVASGKKLHTFRHKGSHVPVASFNAKGDLIVTSSDYDGDFGTPSDNIAAVWSVASGQMFHIFQHNGPVAEASFSPRGDLVITASRDHTASVWNVATGAKLQTFQHDDEVLHAAINAKGDLAITGSKDSNACVWSVASGKKLQTFHHHMPEFPGIQGVITSLSFNAEGDSVLTTSWLPEAYVWNVSSGAKSKTLDFKFSTGLMNQALASTFFNVFSGRPSLALEPQVIV